MPEFRLPYPNVDLRDPSEALKKLNENLNELVKDYNKILRDLDAEVFYHIIPIKTGSAVETGATTLTHRIKVVIDSVEYYAALDPV